MGTIYKTFKIFLISSTMRRKDGLGKSLDSDGKYLSKNLYLDKSMDSDIEIMEMILEKNGELVI